LREATKVLQASAQLKKQATKALQEPKRRV
jgi:hypothetical protein